MKPIALKRGEDRRVRAGHPWIFSNEIKSSLKEYDPGDLVRVQGAGGNPLGIGYVNPLSLIAVRLLVTGPADLEEGFVENRMAAALAHRRRMYPGSDVYRVVYGESDALPGLVVDRYGGAVALQILTAGMERLREEILRAVVSLLKPEVVVARNDTRYRRLEGLPTEKAVLRGEWKGVAMISLDGIDMAVDLMDGQKTGLFLDQRDNLPSLAPWCSGARVLDCFCYTGAWGLKALRYGAVSATAIDSSAAALRAARRNVEINNMDGRWDCIEGDATEVLGSLRDGAPYDVAVLDPPALARRKDRLASAKKLYREINKRAIALLKPGGVLVSCSCSYHLDRPGFKQILNEAATLAGRRAVLVEERGQSRDHPALLAARETDYLKCLVLRVL